MVQKSRSCLQKGSSSLRTFSKTRSKEPRPAGSPKERPAPSMPEVGDTGDILFRLLEDPSRFLFNEPQRRHIINKPQGSSIQKPCFFKVLNDENRRVGSRIFHSIKQQQPGYLASVAGASRLLVVPEAEEAGPRPRLIFPRSKKSATCRSYTLLMLDMYTLDQDHD